MTKPENEELFEFVKYAARSKNRREDFEANVAQRDHVRVETMPAISPIGDIFTFDGDLHERKLVYTPDEVLTVDELTRVYIHDIVSKQARQIPPMTFDGEIALSRIFKKPIRVFQDGGSYRYNEEKGLISHDQMANFRYSPYEIKFFEVPYLERDLTTEEKEIMIQRIRRDVHSLLAPPTLIKLESLLIQDSGGK